MISIHAPRKGSDEETGGYGIAYQEISIHAPREGSDSETAQRHRYVL